jgi:GTPase SAR1 family protein
MEGCAMTADLTPEEPAPPRKPRIALMGEFSAGKSTLANLLMHETFSPVQVTATQMPPVWYARGEGPAVRIAMDGSEEPLGSGPADAISIRNTRAIRKFVQADILEACDIIDMPGSSDPNITEDIWQRMLPLADAVVWCTPATQAWRQSEAAMWEEAPERLFRRSLLLITRIDKVLSEGDRQRVVSRVQREAGSVFREVIPVSLIDVRGAEDDPESWRASGLEAVLDGLQEIIEDLETVIAFEPQADPSELFAADPVTADDSAEHAEREPLVRRRPVPHEVAPEPAEAAASEPAEAEASEPDETAPPEMEREAPADWVVPRRVVLRNGGQSRRPRRAASGSLI